MSRDSEPHRDSQRPECPGLRGDLDWDAEPHLRGELYASERLTEHATELARAHGEAVLQSTPGPLRNRFGAARTQIRVAYETLARDAHRKHDPSPAEEWLLDNSHVVEEQIREIQEDLPWGYLIELPRIQNGAMRRYPRVYGLCLDYLRHSDARVDLNSLGNYVRAYQRVTTLTIGELWAVPIMLRLGLVLMVGALAVTEASAKDRAHADTWADTLINAGQSNKRLSRALADLDRSEQIITAGFLVQLLKRIRDHDAPLAPAMEWLQARCQELGSSPEELTRLEHLRLAADQVSVGNAITSMRAIAALDWTRFFDAVSQVEEVLKSDPSGAYPVMDQPSRDRCRHAVERLARRSQVSERGVAERAIAMAEAASSSAASSSAEGHVGYYLVDAGRAELERAISYRRSVAEHLRGAIQAHPAAAYLGAMLVLTLGLCLLVGRLIWARLGGGWALGGVLVLFALPASELALALVNTFMVAALPPRLLPKLDFEERIPDEHRTLVVVPSLLENEASLAQLLEDLEVRALANPGENLYFALLTDFTDADAAETPADAPLLEAAVQGIAALNAASPGPERYFLLHRKRLPNPVEGRFMGWERKRGKLEELNALLRGATDTSFVTVTAPSELLQSIRYVITLDADTELPREVARRLVGAMAHPQNRPVLDAAGQRVVRGYGIIQPRVGTLPLSSRRSTFAAIFAGPPGIDPYTTAVSDVYQDLFGEGSFVGKGIYDVDAFAAALRERVPDNRLLSHDLFESSFARSALATDIEVLDEQPASYDVAASRQHRWLRGDWQLLRWLWPRVPVRGGGSRSNDLRVLDLWKLFDNLRRSLVAPALVALLALSWFVYPALAAWSWLMVAGVFVGPLVVRQTLELARATTAARSQFGRLGGDLLRNVEQCLLAVLLIFDQALLSLDGILRTLYRCVISRRRLLEWTTMSQATRHYGRGGSGVSLRFASSGWLALLAIFAVIRFSPTAVTASAPLLFGWALCPLLVGRLGRPLKADAADDGLTDTGRRKLALIARKTWRFFETFVTAEDHWLPPDNFQEEPRGVVAHRTSPTNIGLYLLSVVAARDLGFITARQAVARLENTLATLKRMERRSGHILNWYDTSTLRPLEPQYVSTVDSGNLAAYLWTLSQACGELGRAPLVGRGTFDAADYALELAALAHAQEGDKSEATPRLPPELGQLRAELGRAAASCEASSLDTRQALVRLSADAQVLAQSSFAGSAGSDARYWVGQASLVLAEALAQLDALAPCLGWLANTPALFESGEARERYDQLLERVAGSSSPEALAAVAASSDLSELVRLARGGEVESSDAGQARSGELLKQLEDQLLKTKAACEVFLGRARQVGEDALAFADAMDFGFLFDKERELFTIGYDVSGARLDSGHYDLLASEARLASLVAISKGDTPVEHWWRLSRPRAATSSGRVLLSWSGSMFEYLMPLLVTGMARDTLLWETCRSAVGRQRSYGEENRVPWGVSEAAYNVMDLGMTYQYRAFGVPGLGLKNGLGQDLVVAPYATALAALVRPELSLENFHALDLQGLDARYGYYEAIDYTKAHVPPGRNSVIVKAFMAHHQGMTLVALCNVLCDSPMPRRFLGDARVKASALLLEERVPHSAPVIQVRSDQVSTPTLGEPELGMTDHVGMAAQTVPRLHLLGHGDLSCLIYANGSSAMTWKGLDVTRFREDNLLEPSGIFVYVRDLTHGRMWSAGQQPVGDAPDYYDASFSIDRAELKRRDESIETVMEVVVSPELPAEMRRITLTNHGRQACELDVTTYCEAVLAPRGADVAHRAFSSMFLETELIPERGAILVRRRPRSAHEQEVWMVQVLSADGDGFGEPELDSSRARFLGRSGSLQKPRALHDGQVLAGSAGHVLDAGLSLRRKVRLEPDQRARATLTTGLANSREAALELLELVVTPNSSARAFELAWADARVELRHLGISAASSFRFQRLLSCVMNAPTALRDASDSDVTPTQGRHALWSQGISGDLPILLLRVDHPDFGELCKDLLLAREFWRLNGVRCDLVLLNEEPEGYLQPLQEALSDLVRSSPALGHENQPGGVFVRRAGQLSAEERLLLMRAARVVLRASAGSLSQQLRKVALVRPVPPPLVASRRREELVQSALPAPLDLQHFNGVGGFSADGREYVMSIGPGTRTPVPWCNVLSNPQFGSVVSESGLGFTWCGNSQRERLTAWSNDSVLDPSGEALYVRDDEDGRFWSATPAPASRDAHFWVRHGQGYTSYVHEQSELSHELTVQVSPQDPVQVLRLRLQNRGKQARKLSIFGVVEWVLGATREATRFQVATNWDPKHLAILASNPFTSAPGAVSFFASSDPVASFTADREEFFGASGTRARPLALGRRALGRRVGLALDPCAALQVSLELAPGETRELSFVLGQAPSASAATVLLARYANVAAAATTQEQAVARWDQLQAVTVESPDSAFDLMVNRWLVYQVAAARLWARSGFYQSSGAYGYRDQLQDVLALLHAAPELAREHLLRAAARQFVEGDVQHWWHPETGEGVRSHCSDDLLWLPYATARYIEVTGDQRILDEQVPFLEARALQPGEEDLFGAPPTSSTTESLYEHCVRALVRGTGALGSHGIPLMGGGDWNDGMNRVGAGGRGESVWLGWFVLRTLQDFAPVATQRGDLERAELCHSTARTLLASLEEHAWDGAWYRRAFWDDGAPLGSRENTECRIDAIAQSWSVIATGDRPRTRRAVASSEGELIVPEQRLMLLLKPPFTDPARDPGYIRSYPPGIRENGGQYTHGVLWTAQALCLLGEGDRAYRLLSFLNPIAHGSLPGSMRRYQVEPYVVAADVYSTPEHLGRGGWTWYTGSAAWFYRIAIEHVLGLKRSQDRLVIAPCLPTSWTSLRVTYRYGKSELRIAFENPSGVATGVHGVELDGKLLPEPAIPLLDDGRPHDVRVMMGEVAGGERAPSLPPSHVESAAEPS
ncbi:MAG: glucoamylase family protein [Myxococcales bacterium]